MKRKNILSLGSVCMVIVSLLITLGGCKREPPPPTPALEISDQSVDLQQGQITITRMAMDKDGFMVIRPGTTDGKPDTTKSLAIIRLLKGDYPETKVKLVGDNIGTVKLFGVLHYDSPFDNLFNYTSGGSVDPIVTVNGTPVQVEFTVTGKPMSMTIDNQPLKGGVIKLNQVVTDRAVWVILRPSTGTTPLAEVLLPGRGVYANMSVPITFDGASVTVTATLHEEQPADQKYTGDTKPSEDILIAGITVTFIVTK